MDNETKVGCGVAFLAIAIAIALWFFMPYVCMIAWTAVAGAWGLPVFTYWQWFFISWAIRWLFKPHVANTNKPELKVKY